MIRNNPLSVLLVSLLFLSALTSCWFSIWWFWGARELQALEFQYQAMNQTSTAVQSLANDAIEYSRRNPAIDPLLQQFDLKARPSSPAPTAPPAPKPAR
jgi:hypothetical protein